uniref:Uncharacterized protein n=1 Tax=Raphanus sativus TaxID=3726 RepID=A0A650GC72_RAPSA|nr:hypothetical protein [Raphanus sativus]QGW48537.1 hypothetical protein [Raphanus sativus]
MKPLLSAEIGFEPTTSRRNLASSAKLEERSWLLPLVKQASLLASYQAALLYSHCFFPLQYLIFLVSFSSLSLRSSIFGNTRPRLSRIPFHSFRKFVS